MSKTIRWSISGTALAVLVAVLPARAVAESVPEPSTYRMEKYHAPVPEALAGAVVIYTAEAERLWRAKDAVFIDVLPRPPKPKLPGGTIYREKERRNIPGTLWLADVGHGALSPEMEAYFSDGLAKAARGDKGARLVIYCLAECWMSWNAAKRAVSWGYRGILWYPDGTDGWSKSGLPLEVSQPMPRQGTD